MLRGGESKKNKNLVPEITEEKRLAEELLLLLPIQQNETILIAESRINFANRIAYQLSKNQPLYLSRIYQNWSNKILDDIAETENATVDLTKFKERVFILIKLKAAKMLKPIEEACRTANSPFRIIYDEKGLFPSLILHAKLSGAAKSTVSNFENKKHELLSNAIIKFFNDLDSKLANLNILEITDLDSLQSLHSDFEDFCRGFFGGEYRDEPVEVAKLMKRYIDDQRNFNILPDESIDTFKAKTTELEMLSRITDLTEDMYGDDRFTDPIAETMSDSNKYPRSSDFLGFERMLENLDKIDNVANFLKQDIKKAFESIGDYVERFVSSENTSKVAILKEFAKISYQQKLERSQGLNIGKHRNLEVSDEQIETVIENFSALFIKCKEKINQW